MTTSNRSMTTIFKGRNDKCVCHFVIFAPKNCHFTNLLLKNVLCDRCTFWKFSLTNICTLTLELTFEEVAVLDTSHVTS